MSLQSPEHLSNGKYLDEGMVVTAYQKISTDFSFVPAGRYYSDGNFTGQRYREEFLKPLLLANDLVEVDIDDTAGLGSSFLEEAFGGLVREGYFTAPQLHKRLKVVARNPRSKMYELSIWKFIDNAQKG